MAELCIPVEEMTEWGYPDLNDPEIQSKTPRSTRESAVGERRDCDRCKVEFMVVKDNAPTHCIYHHGRVAPQGIGASRQWLFGCCGKGRNEPGCEEGVHVVSDKDDDKKLAEVHAFMTTEDVVSNKKSDTVADVVAMDCEMICESSVYKLTRLTYPRHECWVVVGASVYGWRGRQTSSGYLCPPDRAGSVSGCKSAV
jgi:RNA exonuclease 1